MRPGWGRSASAAPGSFADRGEASKPRATPAQVGPALPHLTLGHRAPWSPFPPSPGASVRRGGGGAGSPREKCRFMLVQASSAPMEVLSSPTENRGSVEGGLPCRPAGDTFYKLKCHCPATPPPPVSLLPAAPWSPSLSSGSLPQPDPMAEPRVLPGLCVFPPPGTLSDLSRRSLLPLFSRSQLPPRHPPLAS